MNYKAKQAFQTLPRLIKKSSLLLRLHQKHSALNQLNAELNKILEKNLLNHCQIANYRDGILILSTTSPAWNHQIRFIKPELIKKLRNLDNYRGLKSIEVHTVQPKQAAETPYVPAQRLSPMSTSNASLISSTANSVTSQKLAKALKKLAKNVKR